MKHLVKKIVKKTIVAVAIGSIALSYGQEAPIVPDISQANAQDYLPLFGEEVPLSERDSIALKYVDNWLQGNRYPHQEADRVVYLFGSGQPTLVCAPLEVCVIYLQPGEQIAENGVHMGDTVRWQIAPAIGADNRTQLVVKPIDVGLETSLVAITDRRTYHIKLLSRRHDYMPGIAFTYPSDQFAAWHQYQQHAAAQKEQHSTPEGVNLADLDFRYRVSDCQGCDFKPVRVYNDGAQTLIELPKQARGDAPALLIASKPGDQLVNYRVQDNKYIVDRLFHEAILIRGVGKQQQKLSITWTGGER